MLAAPACAAPQSSPVGGPTSTPALSGTIPPASTGTGTASTAPSDHCGPLIPDPTVPDTCDSFVQQVDAPAAYGVHCDNDGSGLTLNITACEEIIPVMCEKQWTHPGQWAWATYNGCSLGSFLPPDNYTGAAPWPSQAQCEILIYGAMLQTCGDGTNNRAAVNLAVLPNNTPLGKGETVNVGYPAYIINPTQPRFLSDATCYEGNPEYPTPCALVESPNAWEIPAAGLISQAAVQEAAAASSFYAEYASETSAAAAAGVTGGVFADDVVDNAFSPGD